MFRTVRNHFSHGPFGLVLPALVLHIWADQLGYMFRGADGSSGKNKSGG